jgi:hypothetical protein
MMKMGEEFGSMLDDKDAFSWFTETLPSTGG